MTLEYFLYCIFAKFYLISLEFIFQYLLFINFRFKMARLLQSNCLGFELLGLMDFCKWFIASCYLNSVCLKKSFKIGICTFIDHYKLFSKGFIILRLFHAELPDIFFQKALWKNLYDSLSQPHQKFNVELIKVKPNYIYSL